MVLQIDSDEADRCQPVAATIATVRNWETSTLGERLKFVIARSGKTQNGLGRAAGIESGPMARMVQDDRTGPVKRAGDTLARIAAAGGVDLHWLATGQGQPDKPKSGEIKAVSDRYPSKLAAAKACAGVAEPQAIEAMLTEEFADMPLDAAGNPIDPGPQFFVKRVAFWQQQRNELKAAIKTEAPKPMASNDTDGDGDEDPPMTGRPKKGKGK